MRHRFTGLGALALAAGLWLVALTGASGQAEAGKRGFSFYAGPGGFGLSIGPRYRHRRHYRHYRRSYRPYYAPRAYYAPRTYYAPRRSYGRCQSKASACARNWGWNNRNWRGCMRYYGCR